MTGRLLYGHSLTDWGAQQATSGSARARSLPSLVPKQLHQPLCPAACIPINLRQGTAAALEAAWRHQGTASALPHVLGVCRAACCC